MMYIDKKRFYSFVRGVLCIIAVIMFCVFIHRHSGLALPDAERVVKEIRTIEYEYRTSPENSRIKEAIPKEVVYRYVER